MSVIMAVLTSIMLFFVVTPAPVSASAATSSYDTEKRVITVVTKANWWIPGSESITLKQTKGEAKKVFWKKDTKKRYGVWKVKVSSTDGKHNAKYTLSGASKKINLKPNKTYKITVEWDSISNLNNVFVKYPTWRVGSTWKVSKCY